MPSANPKIHTFNVAVGVLGRLPVQGHRVGVLAVGRRVRDDGQVARSGGGRRRAGLAHCTHAPLLTACLADRELVLGVGPEPFDQRLGVAGVQVGETAVRFRAGAVLVRGAGVAQRVALVERVAGLGPGHAHRAVAQTLGRHTDRRGGQVVRAGLEGAAFLLRIVGVGVTVPVQCPAISGA